jgi:transposase
MSLKPELILEVPEMTVEVAKAAFPKGNVLLTLRDELGTIFEDQDFADLFPNRGQPALSPWRLALVTLLQFRENLSDRQAAEAVRSRIDWKYLLGLELTDPGFDFSVLSEFRSRLLEGNVESLLLEKLLAICQQLKLVKGRGKQRTDATHVLASIRVMNRLELVGETLRAALNELAIEAPLWLREVAPAEWYNRYSRRIENERLPKSQSERDTYAQTVGEDGFQLMDLIGAPKAPVGLSELPHIQALRQVWARHYKREEGQVSFRTKQEMSNEVENVESPYDTEARYRNRGDTIWTGYIVHVSETCEADNPHLITQVTTTAADVHEVQCTQTIQQALLEKGLPPDQHLVDSAYIDAELLVSSRQEQGITLVGPTRLDPSWQAKVAGAYDRYQFDVHWEEKHVHCPQGKRSIVWRELTDRKTGEPYIQVVFRREECLSCPARALCTRSQGQERRLRLQQRVEYEALKATRHYHAGEEGKALYKKRAGVEGTISQGVRAFGLRQTRYGGLAKTHLQHLATAAAINLDRIVAWLDEIPRAATRTSRFAALAP